MLQKWFGLSDPMAEEMLRDRLSFRRFVGLSLDDQTPDQATLWKFRDRLKASGHMDTLFARTKTFLEEAGLMLREGTLVDATIIEAPLGAKRPDGSSSADPAATRTVKRNRPYFGYKAHIAADRRGLIKDYLYDTARVHDSVHGDQLIGHEKTAVYADSAYMDKKRKAMLEERGAFCGIVWRRVRGQAALTPEQTTHNRLVAGVRALVEMPFAWMSKMGLDKARYRGCTRNGIDFGLTCVAYNFKRAISLGSLLR
jgi:IS5 family transposase